MDSLLREMHCTHLTQEHCDCDWCRYVTQLRPLLEFLSAPLPTCRICGQLIGPNYPFPSVPYAAREEHIPWCPTNL